jgi:hypothetical protein
MTVWNWEQHALYEAFGSVDAVASAIREVAPRIEGETAPGLARHLDLD